MTWLDWSRGAYVGLCSVYLPCGCTEQQGPPCLATDDNENGDDDDYDDGNGDDDENDDYNGDENDMNGGLSYTCTVGRVKEHDHGIEDFKSDGNKVNYCW